MSNSKTHAERELEILSALATDPDNRPLIEEFAAEIIALCKKFGNSGQSGGSAPYVAGAICSALKKLLLFETVAPLTGASEEFHDVGDGMLQNIRNSAVFMGDDDKAAYYLDGVVFRTQTGGTWTGSASFKDGRKVSSRQYVKSWPFEPKTFFIDVIEEEVAKDDWEFYIKDESQLAPVFEYYKQKAEEVPQKPEA